MIIREFYKTRKDGVNLYRTYSDINHYIKQIETGVLYTEAIDVENAHYTYEETEILIEENEATDEDLYNALSELGVNDD
jgi:hypothetical protein